jgi:fluoroquinolone resistance protein
MASEFIQDTTFENKDFTTTSFEKTEYENCTFNYCNFNEVDFSDTVFDNCVFSNCNLSLAIVDKTAFRKVHFIGCKILGTQMQECKPFGLEMSFTDCNLNNISFCTMLMRNTVFKLCTLQEADFTDSDFESSVFEECNLAAAIFENTILEKCDFKSAVHFSINPEMNKIKKAIFSTNNIEGLLHKYKIIITE